MTNIHASCVAFKKKGVLILGAEGSGKSDLALRLTEKGGLLVADDQVLVEEKDGKILASCPEAIKGLIEIRGVGIFRMKTVDKKKIPVKLVVQTVKGNGKIDRHPPPLFHFIEGIGIPAVKVRPFEASAPLKILMALNGKKMKENEG